MPTGPSFDGATDSSHDDVVAALGFSSLEALRTAIHKEPGVWNKNSIEFNAREVSALRATLDSHHKQEGLNQGKLASQLEDTQDSVTKLLSILSEHGKIPSALSANPDIEIVPGTPGEDEEVSLVDRYSEWAPASSPSPAIEVPVKRRRLASSTATLPKQTKAVRSEPAEHQAFKYHETVLKKDERKKLLAEDCIECHDYYEAVGPMPARLEAPQWRSTSPEDPGRREELNGSDIQAHKQAISRHRTIHPRAETPPGYWDIGFPDTPQVKEINRRADEMHRRKEQMRANQNLEDTGGVSKKGKGANRTTIHKKRRGC